MSMHPTLRTGSKIKAKRNVLKRYERIDILKKRRKRKDDDSVYGLQKTLPEGI